MATKDEPVCAARLSSSPSNFLNFEDIEGLKLGNDERNSRTAAESDLVRGGQRDIEKAVGTAPRADGDCDALVEGVGLVAVFEDADQ